MKLDEKNDFLYLSLQHSQEMINFADSKANIFLTIQSLLITIGVAGTLISNTFTILNSKITIFWGIVYIVILFTFIITSLIGNMYAINVFQPRGPKEKKELRRKGVFYYGHVSQYENSESYKKKIDELSSDDLTLEYCTQIYQLAKIAETKMNIVKKATLWLKINVLLTIFVLIFTIIIHVIWGGA